MSNRLAWMRLHRYAGFSGLSFQCFQNVLREVVLWDIFQQPMSVHPTAVIAEIVFRHGFVNNPAPLCGITGDQDHALFGKEVYTNVDICRFLVLVSSNKLFVLAQALLETGNFSSRVCREYNNLFGLYDSKNRDYYRFERWEDSVVGYGKMIQYRYKGGNYLHFLKRIGYAEDPRYITKVARMAKSIYNSLFHD